MSITRQRERFIRAFVESCSPAEVDFLRDLVSFPKPSAPAAKEDVPVAQVVTEKPVPPSASMVRRAARKSFQRRTSDDNELEGSSEFVSAPFDDDSSGLYGGERVDDSFPFSSAPAAAQEDPLANTLQRGLGMHTFYAVFGHDKNVLCEVSASGYRRIGKTDMEISSLARRPKDGALFCTVKSGLIRIATGSAQFERVGTLTADHKPVRRVESLAFAPSGRMFCLVHKGSFRGSRRVSGDCVCEIDAYTRVLRPVIVTQMGDLSALCIIDEDGDASSAVDPKRPAKGLAFLAWSSGHGLIKLTEEQCKGLTPPAARLGVSMNSLTAVAGGTVVFGVGDQLYNVDVARRKIEPLTGQLDVLSLSSLAWKRPSEGFHSGGSTSGSMDSSGGSFTALPPSPEQTLRKAPQPQRQPLSSARRGGGMGQQSNDDEGFFIGGGGRYGGGGGDPIRGTDGRVITDLRTPNTRAGRAWVM